MNKKIKDYIILGIVLLFALLFFIAAYLFISKALDSETEDEPKNNVTIIIHGDTITRKIEDKYNPIVKSKPVKKVRSKRKTRKCDTIMIYINDSLK